MRVLVTGGNGFLGSHLVRALVERGHRVRVLAQPGTDIDRIEAMNVEVVRGDLLVTESLEVACSGCDVVFHLAGVVRDWGPRELFWQLNLGGTRNMLEAAVARGVRRIVFTSSLAVHRFVGIPAGDERRPRDNVGHPYGASKIACEDLLLKAHDEGRIEVVIVRPGVFPFGPGDRLVLPEVIRNRRFLAHIGGGRARLCTAFAPNLAEGLCLCATVRRAAGQVYVIADVETPSWRELWDRLFARAGLPPPRRSVPFWAALAAATAAEAWAALSGSAPLLTRYRVALAGRDCVFSSAKARRELGWDPRIDLGRALAITADWLRGSSGQP
jgi:nucleoside-diphosphate-sugar epimerase